MCQYNFIFVNVTQYFCYTHKHFVTFTKKIILYWYIENNASLLPNLFVNITISFLQFRMTHASNICPHLYYHEYMFNQLSHSQSHHFTYRLPLSAIGFTTETLHTYPKSPELTYINILIKLMTSGYVKFLCSSVVKAILS